MSRDVLYPHGVAATGKEVSSLGERLVQYGAKIENLTGRNIRTHKKHHKTNPIKKHKQTLVRREENWTDGRW